MSGVPLIDKRGISLSAMLLVPFASHAESSLDAFIDRSQRYQADYVETTFDINGRRTNKATGTLFLERPNRFRCEYRSPNSNLIVGNDKKAWIYVSSGRNERVTRFDNEKVLLACSAALSAGVGIGQIFDLQETNLGGREKWLVGTAKNSAETMFETVRIEFAKDCLQTVTFKDLFGTITVIQFSQQKINPPLDERLFYFSPPIRPE